MFFPKGDAGKMCKMLKVASVDKPIVRPCCFCGGVNSFKRVPSQLECVQDGVGYAGMDGSMRKVGMYNIIHIPPFAFPVQLFIYF